MEYLKNNWRGTIIGVMGIIMFFVYAWFPYTTTNTSFYSCDSIEQIDTELCRTYGDPTLVRKFNSPDETLNYFWTTRFAEGKPLYYLEPLNTSGNPIVHPRSTNTVGDKVVPGSFLGMYFIYGSIGEVGELLGVSAKDSVLYLTPLFAVIALFFFFGLLKKVFSNNIAFVSTLVAFVFPGWVYYASRSMYHNVLFVSLLIIGLYILVHALSREWKSLPKKYYTYALAGLFVGGALITRTSELIWVGLIVLGLLAAYRKTVKWDGVVLFIALLMFTFVPVIATNYQLYGAPFSIGYEIGTGESVGELSTRPGVVFSLLISPFGFNIKSMAINAYNYLGSFFIYFSAASILGLALWITLRIRGREVIQKSQDIYMGIFVLVSAYLIMFYGSWQITDRIDENSVSIGTSYVRYWLPIHLMSLPFFVLFFEKVLGVIRRIWARWLIAGALAILLITASMQMVFIDSDESLLSVRTTLRETQGKLLKLKPRISPDTVIVLGFKQADKIFFPEYRHIITELVNPRDFQTVGALAQSGRDLSYYHFAPQETVDYIFERDFAHTKTTVATPLPIFKKETLYTIVLQK